MAQQQNNIFNTFWMAGFECTDKLNAFGNRVDFLKLTGHFEYLEQDYKNLKSFHIQTVREGVRWSQVEKKPYEYDWTILTYMITSAAKHGIQQIFDLCHFGYPDDLTPLHPHFTKRFVAFAVAFVKLYTHLQPHADLLMIPINEVSFISWLGGEACATTPYTKGFGWEVKYKLMQAYISAVAAIKDINPAVKIITSEPLINTVPPGNATIEQTQQSLLVNEYQFQTTDMLLGRICPELGGKEEYIDVLGVNYYCQNQWVYYTYESLDWKNGKTDHRIQALNILIKGVHTRYNKPLLITETSHAGEDRPAWIEMIGQECIKVLEENIPLQGICIYPVIDRPDWDNVADWHHSGIWDIYSDRSGLQRHLHQPMADAFKKVQENVSNQYPFTFGLAASAVRHEALYP